MERRAIAVRGTVQGVGFRPFVYGLASRLCLGGSVRNCGGGVSIEIEGDASRLDQFLSDLTTDQPPLSRIEDLSWQQQPPRGERDFRIDRSVGDQKGEVVVSPDVATCEACLAEMFDPRNRRHRYAFLNCTNCGPRLTIVTGAPYDRERTTMAGFEMCQQCQREYDDPGNRRFHAQPTACAVCGPRLSGVDSQGKCVDAEDPLTWFTEQLKGGGIGAMKGLGGYHLVCDARRGDVVAELRRRKHRDEKPFAVMARNLGAAEELCEIAPTERGLLLGTSRPIVLLRKRRGNGVADGVAPGNPMLGVMLPHTPLQHLLMEGMRGPLVMTSGNQSDEPIAIGEPEVFERLAGIADVYLTHNRVIRVRCDDSVVRVQGGGGVVIRRSRGYAPQPVRLPLACPGAILAVGGQLKGTFALGEAGRAIVSHHLGDLDHFAGYCAFEKDIALYEELFGVRPQFIAHDLHPDYASTRYAQKRAAAEGITLIPVQHHHAHMASCMAEHGIAGQVIGVSFDGTGFGTDGAIWGGEFLVGDFKAFTRAAHLRYVPMPGGQAAIKEPWRMALAHAADAQGLGNCATPLPVRERIETQAVGAVEHMLAKGFNAPLTSSAGRLFDAVASLLGLRDRVSYEGQAAMELEWLAATVADESSYPLGMGHGSQPQSGESWELDTRGMIRAILKDVQKGAPAALVARRFHTTLVNMVVQVCHRLREMTRITNVVLSGGVFMNALLQAETELQLRRQGFEPYYQGVVPANDGGISLGQLCIAASQIGGKACV